jgi:Stress responsive A/B Barrel Domain
VILHLVSFRWKEVVSKKDVAHLCEELAAFRQKVDCLVGYHFGPDLALREGNADFGIAAVVGSPEALVEYLEHPAHHELVGKVLGPMIASRQAVQIEVAEPLSGL